MAKRFQGLLLWSVVLVWGANYTVGKWGMLGFDPLTFNLLRFAGATPILFILLYVLEKDIKIKLRDWRELALLGLVGTTIYQILFMSAVKYASATNASLLVAVSPVFTAIFAWLAKQERLGRQGRWGSGLASLGLILVILFGTNKLATGWGVWRGDLIGLLASSVWGLYPVLAHRTLKKYSALRTITYGSLFGTIFLLFLSLPEIIRFNWSHVPLASYGSLLFSIGPVTAYAMVVWYHAISKAGANRVMAYMYAVPVVAVLTAAVILGERIHLGQVIGTAVIFAGISLIQADRRSQPTDKFEQANGNVHLKGISDPGR